MLYAASSGLQTDDSATWEKAGQNSPGPLDPDIRFMQSGSGAPTPVVPKR